MAKGPFRSDDTGRACRAGLNALPDLGSIKPRNAELAGPDAAQAAAGARCAARLGARGLERLRGVAAPRRVQRGDGRRASCPPTGTRWPRWDRRSATTPRRSSASTSCTGAASTSRASSFPGASPYPLIGHGIDFAWSGTSANGDNEDTFVERLCNPDGSPPTSASTHYIYKGALHAVRDARPDGHDAGARRLTPQPTPSADDHLPHDALGARPGVRLRHGRRRAGRADQGQGGRLPRARRGDPVHALAENRAHRARARSCTIMRQFPGTENWFYVDQHRRRLAAVGRLPAARPRTRTSICRGGATAAPTGWASTRPPTPSATSRPATDRRRSTRPTASSSPGTTRRRPAGATARPTGAAARSSTR